MDRNRLKTDLRTRISGTKSPDAFWMGGAGAALMLIFVIRVLVRQGWRSLTPNSLKWLQLARSLLRFLQLAAEISSEPRREKD